MGLITISSVVIPNWQHTSTTVQLRIFADQSFKASDNTLVEAGSISGPNFYKIATCTINTSAKTNTIAAVSIYSTLDSDLPGARYNAYFWDTTTDTLITTYDGFVGFQLPALPTSTTWATIRTYNLAGVPIPIDNQTFDRATILALIGNTASTLTGQIGIANGGTGAATAADARSNLGAAASGANSDITSLSGLTTALSIAQGGTGSTTATAARTALSAAKSGANSDITSLTGLTTPLAVAQGGTGVTSLTANSLLYGNGTSAIQNLSIGSTGTVLTGTGGLPSFSATPTLTSITLTGAFPLTLSSAATNNKSVLFVDSQWRLVDDNANFYYESATSPVELNIKGRLRLRGTTAGTVSHRAPASTTSSLDYDYTWPTDYGTSGYMLTTDGLGGLSWTPNAGTPGMGITSITATTGGAQTGPAITFATGTAGTNFTIDGSANTFTFNIPSASASARGLITTGAQTIAGSKTFSSQIVSSLATGTAPFSITSTTAVANLTLAADSQLPTISTAGKVSNSATTATTASTASTIVLRDGSGNFTATLAGNVTGTVATANGGTGLTSYTLGDTIYCSATNVLSRLTGNITATRKFLSQVGTGSASSAPIWNALVAADIPSIDASKITTGVLAVARGGFGSAGGTLTGYVKGNGASVYTAQAVPIPLTDGGTGGITAQAAANSVLGFGTKIAGDIFYYNGTNVTRLPIGSTDQVLSVVSGAPAWKGLTGGGGAITSVSGNDDIEVTDGAGPAAIVGRTSYDTTTTTRNYIIFPNGPGTITASLSIATSGTTGLSYYTIYLPMKLVFSNIGIVNGSTVGAGANLTLAIYDTSGNRLALTGTGALAGVNTFQSIALTSATTLSPGYYVIAYNLSATSSMSGISYAAPSQRLFSHNGSAGTITGSTGGVPNTTVTFSSSEVTTTFNFPLIRLGS